LLTHHVFENSSQLADHAAALIARQAREAIRARGRFVLALSGGKTPGPTYERLARARGQAFRIDWGRTHVLWSDERGVAPDDSRANVAAARAALFNRICVPESNLHPMSSGPSIIDGADAYEIMVRTLLGSHGRIDLILLGLGADGHVASLFPSHQALQEDVRWILPVHAPATPPWRITMTLPLIRQARHILFLIAGENKRAALANWMENREVPAARVSAGVEDVTVLLDRDADPTG